MVYMCQIVSTNNYTNNIALNELVTSTIVCYLLNINKVLQHRLSLKNRTLFNKKGFLQSLIW